MPAPRTAPRQSPSPAAGQVGAREVISFRFPPSTIDWLRERAGKDGRTVSSLVLEAVHDPADFFGLPSLCRDGLEADRKALGMSLREYIQFVMYRRYEQVQAKGPGFDDLRRRAARGQKGAKP